MKITIKDREIELRYTVRSMMIYENIMGKTFSPDGLSEIIIYFYSTILASSKDTSISYDDFIDWFDQNPEALNDFSDWLNSNVKVIGYIRKKPKLPKQK